MTLNIDKVVNGIVESISNTVKLKKSVQQNIKVCACLANRCESLISSIENMKSESAFVTLEKGELEEKSNVLTRSSIGVCEIESIKNSKCLLRSLKSLHATIIHCEIFILKYGLLESNSINAASTIEEEFITLDSSILDRVTELFLETDEFITLTDSEMPNVYNYAPCPCDPLHMLRQAEPQMLASFLQSKEISQTQLIAICQAVCYVCQSFRSKRLFGQAGGCTGLVRILKEYKLYQTMVLIKACSAVITVNSKFLYNSQKSIRAGGSEGRNTFKL